MKDVLPIPGLPGYFVTQSGEVRSEFGSLCRDNSGRFTLRDKATGKRVKKTAAELLELVNFSPAIGTQNQNGVHAMPAQAQAEDFERRRLVDELKTLREELRRALQANRVNRSLNATLWARLRRFEADMEDMPLAQKKPRMAEEKDEWVQAGNFDDLELKIDW